MNQHRIDDGPELLKRPSSTRPAGYGRGLGRDQFELFDTGAPGDLPGQALLFPDPAERVAPPSLPLPLETDRWND